MAGKIIPAKSATVTVASAAGYITIASTTGYYKGAKAWLSKTGQTSVRVIITEVVSATVLGVRVINDNGSVTNNYGRSDVSAFTTSGVINLEEQFVYSANDTGLA